MIANIGEIVTGSLSPGQKLTVVADANSSGSLVELGQKAGEASVGTTAIAAGETHTLLAITEYKRFKIVASLGFLTYSVGLIDLADVNEFTPITATEDEINAVADLSVNGAIIKTKVISISSTPTGSEEDTAWDLPAKALLLDVLVNVTTAEVTGTTKTLDVGLKSSESGGDADGFVDGVSVASTGLKRAQGTVSAGVFNSNTRGVLMSDYAAGTDADDRGLYREKPHLSDSVTAKSVSYTAGSNNFAEFRGSIILVYVEVA